MLTLPEMNLEDEHIFYLLEGATLQMFGEDSYSVFMETAREFKVHSLAHTAVCDFGLYAISETEGSLNLPVDVWTREMRRNSMLQLLCVRRCLFAPIYEMLDDTCSSFLNDAIQEERLSGGSLYRDAIADAINEEFLKLDADVEFGKYLEENDETHELQIENMHRVFHHCGFFAKCHNVQNDIKFTIGIEDRCGYLVQQFPFLKSIMRDYFTREVPLRK